MNGAIYSTGRCCNPVLTGLHSNIAARAKKNQAVLLPVKGGIKYLQGMNLVYLYAEKPSRFN
jgi:hypothetical protein